MNDIVERLRAGEPCAACWGDTDGTCKVKNAQSGCGCAEAADAIERLRDENREQFLTIEFLRDEIRKLQKAFASCAGIETRPIAAKETGTD